MTIAFILFGSTGDLVKRKLLPALQKLARTDVQVIAVGRKPFSTADYRAFMHLPHNAIPSLQYVQADIAKPETFAPLRSLLASYATRIFYLATGHEFFTSIVAGIERFQLHQGATVRAVFEKPFGVDGESARALDARLKQVFSEEQIFRIDHYLAKERVRVLVERKQTDRAFAQGLTQTQVARITICAHEQAGVGERLSYYHSSGALKDMIQNHLLHVLALLCMRLPFSTSSEAFHDAKDSFLESLSLGRPAEHLLGQYRSYAQEVQRAERAPRDTETFARVTLYSSLPHWQGVPFVLETGKKGTERHAFIRIAYRDGTDELIEINPRHEINHEDGYAFLLQELSEGKRTWFVREDAVLEGWRLIDTLETMRGNIRFVRYEDGRLPL